MLGHFGESGRTILGKKNHIKLRSLLISFTATQLLPLIIRQSSIMKGTLLLFLFGVYPVWAYNIDIGSAVNVKGPENGLFGHSVAVTQDAIYVGAPKDELHGNVFKCSTSSTHCKAPISSRYLLKILIIVTVKRAIHFR